MRTKQLILTGLFMCGALTLQAQTTLSNDDVTSGGVQSGTYGIRNTFYGVATGKQSQFVPTTIPETIATGKDYNTYIGSFAGYLTNGSDNVFVGSGTGLRPTNPRVYAPVLGSGNVFIGTNVRYTVPSGSSINNRLAIDNSTIATPLIWGDFEENQLKFNGKVGIGFGFGDFPETAGMLGTGPMVDVSAYNLFVYGGILTEEVRVILNGFWADYVFEEDYSLPTLPELEAFIKENKHLPNVPSAKEVKENGIELGEMAKIQQEKIEELTLYIIEQDKTNKQQQAEIDELKQQVKFLLEAKK